MGIWGALVPQRRTKAFFLSGNGQARFASECVKRMFQNPSTFDNQTSFHILRFQYFPSCGEEVLILCLKLF